MFALALLGVRTLVLLLPLALAGDAFAFAFHPELLTPAAAARWASTTGLADGIQLGIEPGFAEDMGATNAAEIAAVEQVIAAGAGAWENPGLQIMPLFDAAAGFEIELFAVPTTDPIFVGNQFFGFAMVTDAFQLSRPLTNGQSSDGYAITSADVFINIDRTSQAAALLGLTFQQRLDSLQRLWMHELGHALGLGHPNAVAGLPNYDTDLDPLNLMSIDPLDPFGDLIVSANRDEAAIMSNQPCGPVLVSCSALFFTTLRPDDAGGRDVLYPVPEPGMLTPLALAVGALLALRRRRAH